VKYEIRVSNGETMRTVTGVPSTPESETGSLEVALE
jgi:hypothetical protein